MSKKYFTEATEQAIHDYLNSSGHTRQRIYSTVLHPAFNTMTESIINRYFYGVDESDEFDEVKFSAISHLLKVLPKFNPTKAKAFSFCQTVIKNHCNDWFRLRKQRGERFIPHDYEHLVERFDRPDEAENDSMVNIFSFIDHVTTGTTSLSPLLIHELRKIKRTCTTIDGDYDVKTLTGFYKKVFADKTQGWRETNILKDEFRRFLRNNLN